MKNVEFVWFSQETETDLNNNETKNICKNVKSFKSVIDFLSYYNEKFTFNKTLAVCKKILKEVLHQEKMIENHQLSKKHDCLVELGNSCTHPVNSLKFDAISTAKI